MKIALLIVSVVGLFEISTSFNFANLNLLEVKWSGKPHFYYQVAISGGGGGGGEGDFWGEGYG